MRRPWLRIGLERIGFAPFESILDPLEKPQPRIELFDAPVSCTELAFELQQTLTDPNQPCMQVLAKSKAVAASCLESPIRRSTSVVSLPRRLASAMKSPRVLPLATTPSACLSVSRRPAFCAALRSSMTRRAAGAAAELEASGVRVPALCDLLDLPAVVVVVGTLGVLDAGACSGVAAAAPISCLSWMAKSHTSRIAWRWSASAWARSSIVGHR